MDTSRLKQLAQELQNQKEMEKSIEVAKKRQRYMLPNLPKVPGIDFHALYIPATTLSGDFYDFVQVGPNLIGIVLGDVSGHGIEAGIIMGMAKKAIQIYAKNSPNPQEVLAVANADLAKDMDGETFVSASYAVLDTASKVFRFARAGHNPPYLVNPQRDPKIKEIRPNGMVIGVDKSGKRFPLITKEEVIQLQGGDLIFQYTDGIVEAPNKRKEEFSEERLQELLLKNYALNVVDLVQIVEDALMSHIGACTQEDDLTMIAMKVQ